jgi:hypothetical protein
MNPVYSQNGLFSVMLLNERFLMAQHDAMCCGSFAVPSVIGHE